jgi:hypothetical protein
VVEVGQKPGKAVMKVNGWSDRPYRVVVVGLRALPQVVIDGKPVAIGGQNEWAEKEGRVVLTVTGQPLIELRN